MKFRDAGRGRLWALVLVFVLVFLALAAAGIFYYHLERRGIEEHRHHELAAIGTLKAGQIEKWLVEREADLNVMTWDPWFKEAVGRWLSGADSGDLQPRIQTRLRQAAEQYRYADVLLVDGSGEIALSAKERPHALERETRQAISDARTSGELVRSRLYRCDCGTVQLDFVGVMEMPGSGVRAFLVFRSQMEDLLFPLIQSWPLPSESAETLLVTREGDSVVFLNSLRHSDAPPLSTVVSVYQEEIPAVQAVLGRTGLVRGRDYRGVEVLSDLRPIAGTPWFLVSKVDESEFMAELHFRWRAILLLVGLATLFVAAAMVGGYRRKQARVFRSLYEGERRHRETLDEYRATLYSIGDAVITTDRDGRVRWINHVAEELTGWTEAQGAGKPLDEVFRIVNEETRHPVENPVAKVLRAGGIVGLANHTVLLSRSGTEYPIADSGSPVLGADGAVIGVVLVFRDQTREREAERTLSEAEQRFRGFFESAVPGIALHQIEVGADGIATGYRYLDVNPAFYLQTGLPRESVVGRSAAAVFGTEEAPYLDVYDQVVRTALPKKFEVYFEPLDRHFEIGAFRTGPGQFATVFLDVSGLRRAEKERVELEAQLRQAVKMEAVGRLAGGVAHDFNNMLQVINSCSRLALEVPGVPADAAALVGEIEKAGSRSAVLVRQLLAFARKQPIDPLVLDLNQLVDSSLSMLGRMIGEDIRLAWMPGAELWPVQVDPGQTDQLLVNLVVNARDAIRDVGCITVETSNVSLSEEYCRTNKGFKPGDFVLLAVSDDGCGMDRETLARVFEPFFTTKTLGQGSGLGLATVYGVVKQNDGFINVYSEVGKGTTFRIYLPRSSHEKSELVTPDSAPSDPESVTETVLLVEDEETLLRLGTLLLERTGYKVLPCLSPGDAIRTSDEYRGVIHVLLTDVVMPEMNGRELYQRLVQSRPEMKCLYMSGYTANVIVHHGVLQRGVQFIEKPFSRESLASKLRETLRG